MPVSFLNHAPHLTIFDSAILSISTCELVYGKKTELTFPESTDRRMQELMDRNYEETLSGEEKKDSQALVDINEELSLVRAQAFRFLHRDPASE